ncbi:MAG: DEAD/DEAH box helicase family protein [Cypionkella sp.]
MLAQQILDAEPGDAVPEPHEIQRAALVALVDARAHGLRRGLVVLATGLGKTWLAAFDSQPFARVLFVAHREEILTQAMSSFRRIRPEARFGRYDGSEKTDDAELIFASIQTLGAAHHLRRFAPDAFDYIVVDEFHHAAASSYRSLLDHFTPRFLLGLTATPDRSDGADLLSLCDDNLLYQCDLFEGIDASLLSPFRYVGVPDAVDYAQIPWRSSRFDLTELEAALATEARAQTALEALHDLSRTPAAAQTGRCMDLLPCCLSAESRMAGRSDASDGNCCRLPAFPSSCPTIMWGTTEDASHGSYRWKQLRQQDPWHRLRRHDPPRRRE